MQLKYKNALACLAMSVAAVAAVELIGHSTAFGDLQLWTYDFVVTHSPEPRQSPDITVVDFDDATLSRVGQFPIPRDTVAQVISRIADGGAKVIGLDVLLTEARQESQDAEMERALLRSGNVVLAAQSGSGGVPPILPLRRFCDPDPSSFGDCKRGAFGYAPVNLPVDPDGFIRRLMLFSFDEHRAESFALRVAELFTAKPLTAGARAAAFSGHVIPYADRTGTVLIGSWARQPAHNVSALDVLDGRTQQSDFRNKIVLVGQSNDAARDREFTPMFRLAPADAGRLRLPGIQIHAAAIATLLDGTAVRPTPKPFVLAVNFGLSCLAVYLLMRWQLRYSLLGVTLLVLAAYGFSQLLFTSSHVWFPYLSTQISILLIVPLTLAYQFVLERGQGTELMNLFTRYMAPEVAREIWRRRNEVTLAGEERIATVLFSDIRSFTEMTAGKPSQLVLAWLNNYFTEMEQVITEERGFLNKYIGDGLMVLFGVPLSDGPEQDAARAVRTALRMLERVEELNRTRPANSDFPCFRIGIGVHTGRLTAGSIGSQKRLEFSAIGDSVNLASRCESLNKEFKSEIIITEATYQLVKDQFTGIRDLGEAQVRGFRDKIRMYTIQTKQSEGRTETDEEGQSVPHLSVSTSGPDSHGPEHNAVKSI